MSDHPLRLGLAGLGTVGAGVLEILARDGALIAQRARRPLQVVAVSARDRTRERGVDLSPFVWEADPVALAARPDVDVFVEVLGGHEGVAKAAVEAALKRGADVVTANKALLAHHGQALAELAEANGATIRFEAAVAGGIPVIKALTEGLAANRMSRVMGVMNGTCNYILTRMQASGKTYAEVFAEAQALGYVEADPTLDVGGIDAAHKLALLAAVAFGTRVDFGAVATEGIERITIEDIEQAADMGFRVKLLGVAQLVEGEAGADGSDSGSGLRLMQRMSPCLVPTASPLGQLEGGTNMVVLEGAAVGQVALRGPGAGAGPTASAVLADVIDLARGIRVPCFGVPAAELRALPPAQGNVPAPYYLRMRLLDRPGTLGKVTAVLGEAGVSINRMRQYGHFAPSAPVLIVTHPCTRAALERAMQSFAATGVVEGEPVAIRIEEI